MKNKAKVLSIALFLAAFIILASFGGQRAEWKGKIDIENGIKVIKNPGEPLYGEIKFELEEDLNIGNEEDENYMFYKGGSIDVDSYGNIFVLDTGNYRIQKYDERGNYLRTIGRKGQGPGEFQRPKYIYLDSYDNLYLMETRKIHIFDKKGNFKNAITLSGYVYFPSEINKDGNIITKASSGTREKPTTDIVLLDSKGRKLKTIASFPDQKLVIIRGRILGNYYYHRLIFCPLSSELGIYGYSSEYRLFVINSSGKIEYIIEKDEPLRPITRKEKNKSIDGYIEIQKRIKRLSILSRGEVKKGLIFPKNRPFYTRVLKDDKDRIYVRRFKSPFDKENGNKYDMFSKEGYFLYRVTMPPIPIKIIKNGCIYRVKYEEETGYLRIKRYKIKNWDQIKEGEEKQ